MADSKPELVKEDDVWVIRVPQGNGKVQEFRCASESQARALAQVLRGKEQDGPLKTDAG